MTSSDQHPNTTDPGASAYQALAPSAHTAPPYGWSLLVFVAAISLYVLSMPLSITLEDAGLFQMVCHNGGIGHPPGYPLFILGCQLFVGLPFFDTGVFAGNLLSSIYAALTCVLLIFVVEEMLGDRRVAVFVALLFGVSATFWSQAIIIEVYSLATLLLTGCLWCCLLFRRTENVRYLYAAAFVFALGLSNHWPLQGLATPALMAIVAPRWRSLLAIPGSPKIFIVLASLGLGLLPYLSLLQTSPAFAIFGAIETWEQFINYVSRAPYDDQFEIAGWGDKLQFQQWVLLQTVREFSLLLAPLLVLGLFLSFREMPLSIAVGLVLLYFGGTSLLILLLGFEFSDLRVAIFRPYPVVAYIAPAVWLGLGSRWLYRLIETSAKRIALILPGSVLLLVCVNNLSENYRRNDNFAVTYANQILRETPENSVLFVTGDNGVGLLGYMHYVAGIRPDLDLRSWNSLVFPNRLTSAFAPQQFLDQTRSKFVQDSTRPVFSAARPDFAAINHGTLFERSDTFGFDCDQSSHEFISYLLRLDVDADAVLDGHERELLFGLILEYTRQHLGIVLFNQQVNDKEIGVLESLQKSFPGRLATLETLLQYPQSKAGKIHLQAIAGQASASLPKRSPAQIAGLVDEYRGRIALIEPSDRKTAAYHFSASLDLFPGKGNASRCLLVQTYEAMGRIDDAMAVQSRFGDCN